MTIDSSDIEICAIKDSWLKSSIEYALMSWTAHYNRMGKASPYSRMEKIVVGKVSEYAFFNLLKQKSIAFDLLGQTNWYQKDQYDAAINGHIVDIKSNFIDLNNKFYLKKNPSEIEQKLRWILKFQALVPADQLAGSRKSLKTNPKLFVFAYLEGRFAAKSKGIISHAFWDLS